MHLLKNFKFVTFIVLFFVSSISYSQRKSTPQQTEDSIKSLRSQLKSIEKLKGITNDSFRLELINKMSVLYLKKSKDTALLYAESAYVEASNLNLKNLTAVSLFNIASVYEYYKDFPTAEKKYLEWMELRKSINDDEYRWALHELRRFYCKTKEKDKLENIEKEWLVVLDRQLDQGHISPWFDWRDSIPEGNYEASMRPVIYSQTKFAAHTVIFAVSFKLPGVEYLLHTSIAPLLNEIQQLPNRFLNIGKEDLSSFENFCSKISIQLKNQLSEEIDQRKMELFRLIYITKGTITINEISEKVNWSSRQINRYFNQQFGLPLKSYLSILRFKDSFKNIKEGKLFPEEYFADQPHFIKNIKKYSGVVPKELFKNKDDRFIQLTVLPKKVKEE